MDQHRSAFLEELKDLLRIPSISTLPENKNDVRRAAKFVADALERAGLKKVKVIKTSWASAGLWRVVGGEG